MKKMTFREKRVLYEAWMRQSEKRIVTFPTSGTSEGQPGQLAGAIHYVPPENFEPFEDSEVIAHFTAWLKND
jgi:hypothetical protein